MTKREHLLKAHLHTRSQQVHRLAEHSGIWKDCLEPVCLSDSDLLFNPEFVKALSVPA